MPNVSADATEGKIRARFRPVGPLEASFAVLWENLGKGRYFGWGYVDGVVIEEDSRFNETCGFFSCSKLADACACSGEDLESGVRRQTTHLD